VSSNPSKPKIWLVRIEDAATPAEVLLNAMIHHVDEVGAAGIRNEYRGNEVVETEDFRKYGRITLTLVDDEGY
jgi:hypothetical protein